jgi:hypothetical protein
MLAMLAVICTAWNSAIDMSTIIVVQGELEASEQNAGTGGTLVAAFLFNTACSETKMSLL